MSTPTKGISGEPASPRSSTQPGALALLGATALGGVIGSRMGGAPLMLAAGATALALMRKKPVPPAVVTPVPPPQENQPQNLVKQWLEQQTEREQQAPFMPLPHAPDAEDDYTPVSLMADDSTEPDVMNLRQEVFAHLTEPVIPATRAVAVRQTESAIMPAASGWIPGIDPLPSWSESPDIPAFSGANAPASENMPLEAVVSAPVFAGGSLPDEIELTQPPESVTSDAPLQPEAEKSLFKLFTPAEMPPPAEQPAAETERAPEIPVQLAKPGEASFDAPIMLSSTWPAPETTTSPQSAPVVVEAEIILRPRAPMHNTVTSKNVSAAPPFIPAGAASSPAAPESAAQEAGQLPRAPVQSPREQRARGTWRSWWRGD